jgi:hypothetical protein
MPTAPATGAPVINNPGFDLDAVKREAQKRQEQQIWATSANILDAAINLFRVRTPYYDKAQRYYDGDQPIIIASYDKKNKQFFALFQEFCDNVCRVPVEAVAERMQVQEFGVQSGGATVATEAWELWTANRMKAKSLRVHREALRQGDAYVLVWPDDEGRTRIYPQRARQMVVWYNEEKDDQIDWAAKWWAEAAHKKIRLNLYFPDRIEKYEKPTEQDFTLPTSGKSFTQIEAIPHDYGRVPVFHFANDSDDGMAGRSELETVLPLQNALNKEFLDMLVGSEYHALPQRWITGLEVLRDENGKAMKPFEPGADKVWTVANEQARFGQFDAANLEQFLKVQDNIRTEVARLTGIPLHYFMVGTGQYPSGEALRTAEARLVKKVATRSEDFGDVWEDVMKFALSLEGKGGDVKLETRWVDPRSISDEDVLNGLVLKKEIGVSDEQLLSEAGYGDDDVQRMMEEKQKAMEQQQRQFDAGNTGEEF